MDIRFFEIVIGYCLIEWLFHFEVCVMGNAQVNRDPLHMIQNFRNWK